MTEYRCPHDGAACHHNCAAAKSVCFRKAGDMSLTTPWPGFPVAGDMPVSEERAHGEAHMANIPGEVNPFSVVDSMPEYVPIDGHERLSLWFGLSYASWLTMPRVLMEAMPKEWQGKMAELLEEWDRTWDTSNYPGVTVRAQRGGRLVKMDERLIRYRYPDREWIESLRAKA